MPEIDWQLLRHRAAEVAANAHAPYSGLHVGAAGLTDDGRILVGTNVENASYGLTFCAEVSMVGALVSGGGGQLVAVVSCDDAGNYLSPCGRCRQILREIGGPDVAVNEVWTTESLLPGAFTGEDLP
ncbi:MAG: cytidine deaminase [Acidimicrobiales bacterium]|nr:cytidine deaminase [Acidimicrobiales bacterium]